MKLEFELKEEITSRQYIYYTILRKGLKIGTMALNKEPYAQKQAKKKLMTMHNELIKEGE